MEHLRLLTRLGSCTTQWRYNGGELNKQSMYSAPLLLCASSPVLPLVNLPRQESQRNWCCKKTTHMPNVPVLKFP